MYDNITVSPAQYFVHMNSCVIINLATSMTFDAPPKRPVHSGKTIVWINAFTVNIVQGSFGTLPLLLLSVSSDKMV